MMESMMNKPLQFGESVQIKYTENISTIRKIIDVVPVEYDAIKEAYIVCKQDDATFMVIRHLNDEDELCCIFIEIGECENLYLLADAIVD
jgi:hypothetical protein